MANVGTLVVELAASTAKFQQDLGRATALAERSAKSISLAFKGVIGALGVGIGFDAIISAAKDTIHAAAALDDLADATGSTVEQLSKLANQAAISGTSFETLQGLVLKLSAGMAGADDESSNVGRALKFLGVTAKDPAQALQDVAVALSKYADGIGKAALARDLFGKGGPAFLATLKDIANLSDVNATVTTKQAAEAEKLEQAWRRLSVESTKLKDALLTNVVPPLTNAIEQMREGTRIAGGFVNALLRFGSISPFGDIPEKIKAIDKQIADLENRPIKALNLAGFDKNRLEILKQQREFLLLQKSQQFDYSVFDKDRRPIANYTGTADKNARAAGSMKDRISEAQRYLEQLQSQLQKTEELTAVETVLADIESGRLKLSGDVTTRQLLAVAEQIDAANALKKSQQDAAKLRDEEARTREKISALTLRSVEAAQAETKSLAGQNEQMRQETELIGKDATSIERIMQARLDDVIAAKQQELAMARNADAAQGEIGALEDQIRLLQTRKGLLVGRGLAERLAEDAARAKEINDIFVNSFADGVTEVVTGAKSIGDAFRQMEKQIVASITRIEAQKIGESIFGAATSSGGGGIFAAIGPLIAGFFGGGGTSFSGGGFGEHFATGTNFAPGGFAWVGEHGKELVNLPRGSQVIPNNKISSVGGRPININIQVPGNVSRATADQIALQTGVAVQRALAKNG